MCQGRFAQYCRQEELCYQEEAEQLHRVCLLGYQVQLVLCLVHLSHQEQRCREILLYRLMETFEYRLYHQVGSVVEFHYRAR